MALFSIGNRVWFKKAGATPFVRGGSQTVAKTEVGRLLGGRGDATVTTSNSHKENASDAVTGRPSAFPTTPRLAAFPAVKTSEDTFVAPGVGADPVLADPGATTLSGLSLTATAAGGLWGTTGNRKFAVAYENAAGNLTVQSSPTSNFNVDDTTKKVNATISVGPTGTVARQVFATVSGGAGSLFYLTRIADNTTTSIQLTGTPNASLTQAAPTVNTTGTKQVGGIQSTIPNRPVTAPGLVTVRGTFGVTNPTAMWPVSADEGSTSGANTTTTVNPNTPSRKQARIIATGVVYTPGGTKENKSEIIDARTSPVGLRTPSGVEGAGVVCETVRVTAGRKSPDGTKANAGRLYWVNWGSPNASDIHATKWRNRIRFTLHAEEDLLLAS